MFTVLLFKTLLVCPTQKSLHAAHISSLNPLFVYLSIVLCIFGFIRLYIVFELQTVMFTLVCLNRLVIFCIIGLQYVKVIQGFELWIVLIFQLGAFKLCCMYEFRFWIKVCEKLLAFDMCCIIIHSFSFHCDDSKRECTHVINYLYVASIITSCSNLLVRTTIVLHFKKFVIFILTWSVFIFKIAIIAKNQFYTFSNLKKIFVQLSVTYL